MKDRVKSRVWQLVGINAVALIFVFGLAYGAGTRSPGLSLLDFGQMTQVAGYEFLAALFLVFAMSVALLVQLGIKVVKPTREIVEFSERLLGGDYETRANITPDDYGVIAENWNRLAETVAQANAVKEGHESLRSELAELEKIINQVARGDVSSRAEGSHPLMTPVIESFNVLADNYARRMEKVRTATNDISGAAVQVAATATEMANGAQQEELATMNAAAAIAQLSQSTQQVAMHAAAASEAARKALELSDQGSHAVRDTADGMQRIRTSMQATAEKIKSLADRSLEIYEIINVIHETNLLALNALMESSRGSQAAQPMNVVSAEMKKLGDHSRASTREIVTLLKSIQAESNEAVAVMEQSNRVAASGAELTEQANRAFAGIAAVLQQTAELAQSISTATAQQVQGTETVAAAVQEIVANLRQNASKGRQSARMVEQVVRSSEQLTQAVTPLRPAPIATVVKPDKVGTVSAAAVIGRA